MLSPPIISNDDIYKIDDTGIVSNIDSSHSKISEINQGINDQARGSLAQGPDGTYYFIANNKLFIWRNGGKVYKMDWPQPGLSTVVPIIKLWVDSYGNIYAGAENGGFHITEVSKTIDDKKHVNIINAEIKKLEFHSLENFSVHAFIQDPKNKNKIWIGTSGGLFHYNINQRTLSRASNHVKDLVTITGLSTIDRDNIWFSTLEKGMGKYNINSKTIQYFPYTTGNTEFRFPVRAFCFKSPHEFFVLLSDYYPVIFNNKKYSYSFTSDSVLTQSIYQSSDLKMVGRENLLFLKGGKLYQSENPESRWAASESVKLSRIISLAPFIRSIELFDGTPLATLDYFPQRLKKIFLDHRQNNLVIYCDADEAMGKRETNFFWKMDGYSKDWQLMAKTSFDSIPFVHLASLNPGTFKFELKLVYGKDEWIREGNKTELVIVIRKPLWQYWWVWLFCIFGLVLLIHIIATLRVRRVRKKERLKAEHEKQLLELEAKALRAQMNPHFIFNSLNSIKSLINKNENDAAANYLTTFSKLIRTLFQNSDRREVSLYEELETCKFYTQLERMRFGDKVRFIFIIDETIDLKDFKVPALILQPFVENAIWHGLIPKEAGGIVTISVKKDDGAVQCIIDDNGIGRERSKIFRPQYEATYQSKGIGLMQSRLELDKLLNEREATILIIDKKDGAGDSEGTKVIITFKENRN